MTDGNFAATEEYLIGRVLRSSTVGFACGTRSGELSLPAFGAFVSTRAENRPDTDVIGLIYAIRIDDDPLVRQLIMANHLNTSTIRDQRENRMVPVEMSVINIGYRVNGDPFHNLPPRPPISLDPVVMCSSMVIQSFTQKLDFFQLILNAAEVPSDELIAAALRNAAAARPIGQQQDFLIRAGRQLVRLLSNDLLRLNHLLQLIKS